MDCRSYYVHLKPEDFKFVKPETKKTSEKGNVYNDKVKEIKEKKEKEVEEERHYNYVVEYHHDYDDGGSEEVQSERRDSEAYKPLASEIDEWLQAVEALSSRATVCSGRLFGDLDPVPFIDEVDPAPGACFNCRQAGHPSRACAEPRTAFCINCGRRGESVVNCPRCGRQQYEFFARRREEERRRAASVCREGAVSARTTSRERALGGRSRSVGRQGTKAAGVPEGSESRATQASTTNKCARSRREAVSRDRRDDPQSEAGVAEKPIAARSFGGGFPRRDPTPARLEGPKDHRGGKEPDEILASERPRRRRIRRRRRRRDRRENPQGTNPALQEQSEEERRRNNKAIREPTDNGFAAPVERERPISTAVECRREVVAARTETRRVEERQPTAEDHVAKREQRAELYWAEEFRRECENSIIRLLFKEKSNELGIKPKKRSEEEKIPINVDEVAYLRLFERMKRQLSAQFCELMESMQLSRPEVNHILVLLNEIQHYDTIKQELIIMDELLLESREKKWWKTSENREAKI